MWSYDMKRYVGTNVYPYTCMSINVLINVHILLVNSTNTHVIHVCTCASPRLSPHVSSGH